MTDTAAIESLRSFAERHGELQFAHLCTAALAGEEWARERIAWALVEFIGPTETGGALDRIRDTDTSRPGGAIARGIEV